LGIMIIKVSSSRVEVSTRKMTEFKKPDPCDHQKSKTLGRRSRKVHCGCPVRGDGEELLHPGQANKKQVSAEKFDAF